VPIGKARLKAVRFFASRATYSCSVALLVLVFGSRALQNAVAEGDTRTITMHHIHTDEDITITFKRDGIYDQAALEKLNWFLRDWRKAQATTMDPHLIDLVWEVQRESGSNEPIWVVCGYRSPATNAMLRNRSANSGVAKESQHMLGHAMDFYIPGVNLEHLREIGLRLARGGVGFYPTSGSPFVHMDTGNIRMWPRMSHEELARVFPDGKTVQIPSDGKPLPGYALALAEVTAHGSNPSGNSIESARHYGVDVGTAVASNEPAQNPFARLLGLKMKTNDEDDDSDSAAADPAPSKTKKVVAAIERTAQKAVAETDHLAKIAEAKITRTAALVHAVQAAPPANPLPPDASGNRLIANAPNQIIASRGYWQSQPNSVPTQNSAGTQVASADPNMTGSLNPLTTMNKDRAPSNLALGYAEQPQASSSDQLMAQNGMTTVAKDSIDQPHSSFQHAIQLATAAVHAGRLDSPWLRAIVLSPSVHHFMTTLALGTRDLTSLAALMVKPATSVLMTFSTDPTMGLPHDHFSRGTAIVFLPTVTYPTRTASLQ
jgi:uncharacterized protein YcbK (DUF882 family)